MSGLTAIQAGAADEIETIAYCALLEAFKNSAAFPGYVTMTAKGSMAHAAASAARAEFVKRMKEAN